jgi:hypothetical protein
MRRLANVSIDLDGLRFYHRIHGIEEPADPVAIFTVALPRFVELFAEHGIRATLFVIAEDLDRGVVVDALRKAMSAGHEVASHTFHHPYDLRSWSERGIATEIAEAEDAIRDALGVRPVGFRTPGYNVDTRIVRILAERGYRYDSSVFPCPPYYFAKAAVMAAMALTGKQSGSSMTDPASLRAPLQPYRPSRWDFSQRGDRKHSLPLWEIPIGVTRVTRLPVIGTSIGALSPMGANVLYRTGLAGSPTIQLEFHGIDLMDFNDGLANALVRRQPDARRPWQTKRATFASMFSAIGRSYSWVTLDELSQGLEQAAGPIVIGD